jgi:hypothetical protein
MSLGNPVQELMPLEKPCPITDVSLKNPVPEPMFL